MNVPYFVAGHWLLQLDSNSPLASKGAARM
jgi:hypothetical protein